MEEAVGRRDAEDVDGDARRGMAPQAVAQAIHIGCLLMRVDEALVPDPHGRRRGLAHPTSSSFPQGPASAAVEDSSADGPARPAVSEAATQDVLHLPRIDGTGSAEIMGLSSEVAQRVQSGRRAAGDDHDKYSEE
jgi:hypothetical protein